MLPVGFRVSYGGLEKRSSFLPEEGRSFVWPAVESEVEAAAGGRSRRKEEGAGGRRKELRGRRKELRGRRKELRGSGIRKRKEEGRSFAQLARH